MSRENAHSTVMPRFDEYAETIRGLWAAFPTRSDPYRRSPSRQFCRAEASRLRAILSGSKSVPYSSVAERLDAAQKRTRLLSEP
jgi:hypothetical protein